MHREVEIPITLEPGCKPPVYATDAAAGADLAAALEAPMVIPPGERAVIPTGMRLSIPEGYEAQVRPRSGLALESGVTVLNAPGTVDADYRGEVRVIIINHGAEEFTIEPGDRIAQIVISPVTRARFVGKNTLGDSERGEGGFGSTGV